MSAEIVDEILAKATLLSPEEQLLVISVLTKKTKTTSEFQNDQQYTWSEMVGLLPYPSCGEDAQAYISKLRSNADNCRELQRLKDNS